MEKKSIEKEFKLPRYEYHESSLKSECERRGVARSYCFFPVDNRSLELNSYEESSPDTRNVQAYLLILEDEINRLWKELAKLKQ